MIFHRDNIRLFGELTLPAGSGPFPAVIISHGFGGNCERMRGYVQAFAEKGIAACAFDFAGASGKSGGDPLDSSVLTEAADLQAVLDELAVRDEIDEKRIFLMGNSQGGMVSAYVASQRPQDVRSLILLYPAFVIHDDARRRCPDPKHIPEKMSVMGRVIGRAYNEDAMSFDIYDMIPAYTGDALIIHGRQDKVVPLRYAERAAEVFPSAQLIVFDEAGHGFRGDDMRRAADLAARFIREHL